MGQEGKIQRRLFIVGCSRSGTTLLQVSVAAHPRIQSFPETFIFPTSIGDVSRLWAWMGVATGREMDAFQELLKTVKRPDLAHFMPEQPRRYKTAVRSCIRVFDRVAADNNADLWLEKSPMHVHYVDLIRRYVPRTHIIHILRDGRDVVASICDRARRYGGEFKKQADPAFGIRRWNRALKASRIHFGRSGHTFVLYDELVERPAHVMRRICRDVGIAYDERMASGDTQTAETVIPDERDWIKGAAKPPQSKSSKFEALFDASERRAITDQLNLDLYETMRLQISRESIPPKSMAQSLMQRTEYLLGGVGYYLSKKTY